jgi:aarF domain-containing kinase
LIPIEYTETLKILQDQCVPSSIHSLNQLFIQDTGHPLEHYFSEFEPEPIGVASLAQVHRAILKETNEPVAVKIQHPIMDIYAKGDIQTCFVLVKWVKRLFPMFTLDWLAEEVKKNLPKEMDFTLEAQNAQKIAQQFKGDACLRIPVVKWAQRRILCMECK